MDDVKPAIGLGQTSYVLFLIAWAALIPLAIELIRTGISGAVLWTNDVAATSLAITLISFVLAWLMAKRADRQIEDEFSAFWQKHQRSLRDALKHSKQEARRDFGQQTPAGSTAQAHAEAPARQGGG